MHFPEDICDFFVILDISNLVTEVVVSAKLAIHCVDRLDRDRCNRSVILKILLNGLSDRVLVYLGLIDWKTGIRLDPAVSQNVKVPTIGEDF